MFGNPEDETIFLNRPCDRLANNIRAEILASLE
jgi:hypothetical protein